MEKLINILPNLITNKKTDLKDIAPNPDVLTKDLLVNIKDDVNHLATMHASYDYSIMPYPIADNASYREIIAAVAGSSLPEKDKIIDIFSQVGKKYDTDGLSAFATIWITSMVYNLTKKDEDKDKEKDTKKQKIDSVPENLQFIFMAAGKNLNDYNVKISDVYGEVLQFMEKNPEISNDFADLIAYAYMLNPDVQDSSKWFNFATLEAIETSPDMQINSDEELFEALKSTRNYLSCIDYIKNTYLNEEEEDKDGYCENEMQKEYKAHLIVAKLASELYGSDPEFDKDNTIGYNIVSQVISLQDNMKKYDHMLSVLTNNVNELENAAGRIEDKIMGRTNDRLSVRFGDMQKYILNHFNAFKLLAKSSSVKFNSNILMLSRLRENIINSSRRATAREIDKLQTFADDVGVKLTPFDKKLRGMEFNAQVLSEIDKVTTETYKKYNHTQQLVKLLASIKRKKGTSLDIDDLDLKQTAKKSALVTPWQESVVKQFYDTIKTDPILKSDSKIYRLKAPSAILDDIRQRLANDPDHYPELASLFDVLRKTQKNVKLKDRAENLYYGDHGAKKFENKELYSTLTDAEATKEEKSQAVKNSTTISQEEKDSLNNLL